MTMKRMTRDLPHVDEVGDLTVDAVRGAIDDEVKIKLRDSAAISDLTTGIALSFGSWTPKTN